jgi:hypothetical protein
MQGFIGRRDSKNEKQEGITFSLREVNFTGTSSGCG